MPRHGHRRCALRALAIVASLTAAQLSHAQQLSGIVTNEQGQRLAAAIVRLENASGRVISQTRISAEGTYLLTAPAGGRFVVTVLRMGFAPFALRDVVVPVQGTTRLDLTVAEIPAQMARVQVRSSKVCPRDLNERGDFLTLWGQVRSTLALASQRLSERDVQSSIVRFTRERRAGDELIRHQMMRREERVGQPPFAAWPADSLAARGYVTEDASGTTFYAPDLTSSTEFLSTHCFEAAMRGDTESPHWMIRFAPVRRPPQGRAELVGELFLRTSPTSVDSVRFWYDGLPPFVDATQARGLVAFALGSDQLPIVASWLLRVPRIGRPETQRLGGMARTTFAQQPLAVLSTIDEGGVTVTVQAGGASIYQATIPEVAVSVVGEFAALPLWQLATLSLEGTSQPVTLNDAGSWTLGALLRVPERSGNVAGSAPLALRLSLREALPALCPNGTVNRSTTVIVGVTTDSTGRPVRTVVEGRWLRAVRLPSGQRGDRLQAMREAVSDSTGATGRFVLCGVPRQSITVRADSIQWTGSRLVELTDTSTFAFVPLTVRARVGAGAPPPRLR
jgi:hypothetical protein